MTEGRRWLDSKKGAPEMNVSGVWICPEWGEANFKQEERNVTGMLGDYPIKGVVSGNSIYLLMYSGARVDYSAKLKASDENTLKAEKIRCQLEENKNCFPQAGLKIFRPPPRCSVLNDG